MNRLLNTSSVHLVFLNCPAAPSHRHWVAYDSDERKREPEIHVRPFHGPGDGFRVSPNGGTNPWWSRDGRELFYERGTEMWSVEELKHAFRQTQ